MAVFKKIAIASLIGATLTGPALAAGAAKPVTVKEYPLNFEAGGASAPITLYKHQGDLAFIVIDSISAKNAAAYRLNVGSIGQYDDAHIRKLPLGVYLPLRRGESVTLRLAQNSTLTLKAHVMVVTGYGESRA